MTRVSAQLIVEVRSSVRGGVPGTTRIGRWVRAAIGIKGNGTELAVRIVGAAEGQRLNLLWRGRDYPTNVLSFPAPADAADNKARSSLGDIVVCAPVVAREAKQQNKRLDDHWAHVLIHGALHLLGHDHERESDATRMERRERLVLARFGIADPYRISSAVSERAAASERR
ncbi:MAG: rRNA maturation RNase YbeY [Gammaproteobacteria bacterium]|nr:rRNA maturation RNase YbeY [Gammaproteobacteria bacterium]